MKLFQLVEALPSLQLLMKLKMPISTGIKVARAIRMITPEVATYESMRNELLASLGTKVGDTDQFSLQGENALSFMTQCNEATDAEVDITLPTVTLDDLGGLSIEPQHLLALDGIFIKEA